MMRQNKQALILLGVAVLLVLIILIIVMTLLFGGRSGQNTDTGFIPTPTAVPYTRDEQGNFTFTPLQKTTVGKTTEKEVEETMQVITKRTRDDTTIYEVQSATPQEVDEIRVRNGVVISERINTFNKQTGFPPSRSVYEKEFGQPEEVIDSVSRLGKHISAYIYAEDGFVLYANRFTDTVYEIHRFPPMSTNEYKRQYAEYLQPAPEYPKEFSDVE